MKNLAIYNAFHRPFRRVEAPHLIPVQAGRAVNPALPDMLGDDTGQSISERNARWAELSVHYWVWKNATPTRYVGFGHYRRYFNMGDAVRWPMPLYAGTSPCWVHTRFWSTFEDRMERVSDELSRNEVDGVLPLLTPIDISLAELFSTVGRREDWAVMESVLAEREARDEVPWRARLSASRTFQNYNMFILRHSLFEAYMEWLFDVLFAVEERISDWPNDHRRRVLGFMGEYLSTVYFAELAADPTLRLPRRQVIFLDAQTPGPRSWARYLTYSVLQGLGV